MATELTWASDVNRAVASAASAAEQSKWELWYLLASLCGNSNLGFSGNAGAWSVVRTCGSTDGTAGNLTADGTDRLHLASGAYTSNDWVFGANTTSGTGRSWALLQSPSALGSHYLIVDFGNATNGKCDLIVGKTLSTNGTTTARPTLTDEWVYSAAQFNNNSVAATHRVHLNLSTRGDFWWYETIDATGIYTVFGVTKLANAHSADAYPVVSIFIGAGNVNATSGLQSGLLNTGCLAGSTNVITKGRNYNASTSPALVALAPAHSSGGAASNLITVSVMTGTNASDTTYNGFPIWLADLAGPELKGRLADVLWASGGAAQGSTTPSATPFDYVKFGHCWLPWVSTSTPSL